MNIILNGLEVQVPEGHGTILEVCKFFGIDIPTLCYEEGLEPYGGCRLCLVEIGSDSNTKLVSSCTYPVSEGLRVRTNTNRVVHARRLMIELHVALCPSSKIIQDLASKLHVRKVRFKAKHEDCVLCGRCVRMCEEQMVAKAIGFRGRGQNRTIGTPFDIRSEECRLCGGCMHVCPACELRCTYTDPDQVICGGCANLAAPCVDQPRFGEMMCYMAPCVACEIQKD